MPSSLNPNDLDAEIRAALEASKNFGATPSEETRVVERSGDKSGTDRMQEIRATQTSAQKEKEKERDKDKDKEKDREKQKEREKGEKGEKGEKEKEKDKTKDVKSLWAFVQAMARLMPFPEPVSSDEINKHWFTNLMEAMFRIHVFGEQDDTDSRFHEDGVYMLLQTYCRKYPIVLEMICVALQRFKPIMSTPEASHRIFRLLMTQFIPAQWIQMRQLEKQKQFTFGAGKDVEKSWFDNWFPNREAPAVTLSIARLIYWMFSKSETKNIDASVNAAVYLFEWFADLAIRFYFVKIRDFADKSFLQACEHMDKSHVFGDVGLKFMPVDDYIHELDHIASIIAAIRLVFTHAAHPLPNDALNVYLKCLKIICQKAISVVEIEIKKYQDHLTYLEGQLKELASSAAHRPTTNYADQWFKNNRGRRREREDQSDDDLDARSRMYGGPGLSPSARQSQLQSQNEDLIKLLKTFTSPLETQVICVFQDSEFTSHEQLQLTINGIDFSERTMPFFATPAMSLLRNVIVCRNMMGTLSDTHYVVHRDQFRPEWFAGARVTWIPVQEKKEKTHEHSVKNEKDDDSFLHRSLSEEPVLFTVDLEDACCVGQLWYVKTRLQPSKTTTSVYPKQIQDFLSQLEELRNNFCVGE
jgi:hypothetical protein